MVLVDYLSNLSHLHVVSLDLYLSPSPYLYRVHDPCLWAPRPFLCHARVHVHDDAQVNDFDSW